MIASCSRVMLTPRSLKKRSFSSSCARTWRDEEDGVAGLRVTELHERALRPLAAFERERLAQHVEALGRELRQAVGPREAAEGDARAVKVPPVVDVVVGDDHDRQAGVRVVVEVDEAARRHLALMFGQGLRRAVKTAVGKQALGGRHGAVSVLLRFAVASGSRNSMPATTPSGSSWTHTTRPTLRRARHRAARRRRDERHLVSSSPARPSPRG